VRQSIRARIEAGEEIALLFSDIREFSTYTTQRGDHAAYRLSQVHEQILREGIDEHGILVKSLGDGIMAAFEEPLHAIHAAVAVQQAIRGRSQQERMEAIDVGIGISSGIPVMTDIDFIGHTVNLAQRLSSMAKGGQVLVNDRIRQAAPLSGELYYIPLGRRAFKGIGTQSVAEVAWIREAARISDAIDRVTLILSERGTIVVEMVKDTKQDLRRALKQLTGARAAEEGAFSAMLQRAIGRLTQRLIGAPLVTFGVAREQAIDQVSLMYRKGTLSVESDGETLTLAGIPREDAEAFLQTAERLRAAAARSAT